MLSVRQIIAVLVSIVITAPASAQYLRSSYFMENSTDRIQLNPALQPARGYVKIPVIGSISASANSNSLGTQDIIDVIDSDKNFYNNDKFYNRLSLDNRLNVNLTTDLISFGFYKGEGFWSVNIGSKIDINASVPKSMFEYLRMIDNFDESFFGSTYDIRNERLNLNAYTEIGVGYSRPINEKLTLGGKAKMLIGLGNIDMDVKQLSVTENGTESIIKSHGSLKTSFHGLGLKTTEGYDGKEFVNDIDFDSFGVAGYGAAIDLGATYQLLDNLSLSAAVLDLGFISWSKGSTSIAIADGERTISYDDPDQWIGPENEETYGTASNGEVLDFDLLGFELQDQKSRTTSLASTLVLGGEYAFLNNRLGVGVLSTTRFNKVKTISELTFSANYRPKSWINTTFSYSVIQSCMKSFGLAVRLGPLMVGTDYMYFGSNTKNVNGYLGLSIPLGKAKNSDTQSL